MDFVESTQILKSGELAQNFFVFGVDNTHSRIAEFLSFWWSSCVTLDILKSLILAGCSMELLAEYGLFLLKSVTIVVAILITVGFIIASVAKAKSKNKEEGQIIIEKMNERFDQLKALMDETTLTKADLKRLKKEKKALAKSKKSEKNRLFLLEFNGDIRASAVHALREEVTALLLSATLNDEVLVKLESPGGIVNAYGLAAAQLQRIKEAKLKLTIAVDKVAASGGYMMACIADRIIAAPFAVIGSIGVIAQLPNFHRWLNKNNIEFEQIMAGEYKRTLTMFGENTKKGREKMQEEVNDIHMLFKSFLQDHRPQLELDKVATGEHWFGTRALELKLVDALKTSDDLLLESRNNFDIYCIHYRTKQSLSKRLSHGIQNTAIKLTQGNSHGGQDYI